MIDTKEFLPIGIVIFVLLILYLVLKIGNSKKRERLGRRRYHRK